MDPSQGGVCRASRPPGRDTGTHRVAVPDEYPEDTRGKQYQIHEAAARGTADQDTDEKFSDVGFIPARRNTKAGDRSPAFFIVWQRMNMAKMLEPQ